MLTTIEGTYENGEITFAETPPMTYKSKVFITFLDNKADFIPKKRVLGTMKGTIKMRSDFNDPLEELKEYM